MGKEQYILRKLVVNHNYHETKQTTWIKIKQTWPLCFLDVIHVKFRKEHWMEKHYAFLTKRLPSFIKFCALSNLLFSFTSCWLAFNQPSWNVLLFSCNPIGKHCPSGPGYSSHTVTGILLRVSFLPNTLISSQLPSVIFCSLFHL